MSGLETLPHELLSQIAEELAAEGIGSFASLRLVSHQFNYFFSHWLYKSELQICFTERDFTHLDQLVRSPYAPHIRWINLNNIFTRIGKGHGSSESFKIIDNSTRMLNDPALWPSGHKLWLSKLGSILVQLPDLRSLTITLWDEWPEGRQDFWQDPLDDAQRTKYQIRRAMWIDLVVDLLASSCFGLDRLAHLHINYSTSSDIKAWIDATKRYEDMRIWPHLCEGLETFTFQRWVSWHGGGPFHLTREQVPASQHDHIGYQSIYELVPSFEKLRHLTVRFGKTYRKQSIERMEFAGLHHLETLSLANCLTTASNLSAILATNSRTLRTLDFQNISLTEGYWESVLTTLTGACQSVKQCCLTEARYHSPPKGITVFSLMKAFLDVSNKAWRSATIGSPRIADFHALRDLYMTLQTPSSRGFVANNFWDFTAQYIVRTYCSLHDYHTYPSMEPERQEDAQLDLQLIRASERYASLSSHKKHPGQILTQGGWEDWDEFDSSSDTDDDG